MAEILLTVAEVAARLKCHPHTVRRWIWAHKLSAVKVGDLVRVPSQEVERLMTEGLAKAPKPVSGDARGLIAFIQRNRKSVDHSAVEELERRMAEGEQEPDFRDPLA